MIFKFVLVLLVHHYIYGTEYSNKLASSYSYKLENIKDKIYSEITGK